MMCNSYLCTKKIYSSHWFLKKKKQIFSLSTIVKMNTSYVEIYRVGNLEADFHKFCLFNFSEIFTILF